MLKESHEWCVERLVACPESGEWQNTLSANFLDDYKGKHHIVQEVKWDYLLLPWENMTLRTFPNAERATKTDSTRSARGPNIFLKNEPARIRPEVMISSFGTAAKYAI